MTIYIKKISNRRWIVQFRKIDNKILEDASYTFLTKEEAENFGNKWGATFMLYGKERIIYDRAAERMRRTFSDRKAAYDLKQK